MENDENILHIFVQIERPYTVAQHWQSDTAKITITIILPTAQWYAPSADINDAWYCMVLHGIAWYCMVLHGVAWYCMVLHGIAWYCMVLHGIALY